MDLSFSEEEEMLRQATARLVQERAKLEGARERMAEGQGFDAALYAEMAELGLLGVYAPEADGGAGASFASLALVVEELGRGAVTSPYFASVVESGLLLRELGDAAGARELLGELATGERIVSLARLEADVGLEEAAIQMPARREGAGWRLDGKKLFVPYAHAADTILVVARTGEGVTLFRVDGGARGLGIRSIPTIARDGQCEVQFDGVEVHEDAILGELDGAGAALKAALAQATIVKSAEMAGGMQACIAMTAEYAKTREQYGKPIGAYQAIQHDMAEMLTLSDTTSSYVYKAAWMVDAGEEFLTAASMLKAHASESYRFVTERSVQIHGAIGVTLEHPISLFYQRSKAAESACGDASHHYEAIAKALGL